jgi:hypothetical protein
MNVVAVTELWRRTREALLRDYPDIDPETLADTLEGQTEALDVARQLIRSSREDEAEANGLAEYIAALQARRARLTARAEKREAAALSLLTEIGEKTLRDPAFTASLVPTPGKVVFTDTSILPPWAWRTPEPELNKAEIRKRIVAGETVPGARLSNGGVTLRIQT